ncbi:MAG: hypothetical protein L6R36_001134 [Xanthoria steineri]|nr:MAG: hypothetical protein L6R36_001134 [Xanthoria steineri]
MVIVSHSSRCVGLQLFGLGVIIAVSGSTMNMPRAAALSGVGRNYPVLVAPVSHMSARSIAAQPFFFKGHRDGRESPNLEHRLRSSPRSSRSSLASGLAASSLRFIFSQADVIASSALAYRYSTEFYHNLTVVLKAERRSGPPPQKLVIAYGALKLTAAYAHGHGFTEDILAKVLLSFAEYMLDMLAMVLIGAFRVAVLVMGDIRVLLGMDIEQIGD